MKDKIIALIWAWITFYEPNGNDTSDSLQKEDLYGKPDSPISEIDIETNEQPHTYWGFGTALYCLS